MGFNGWQHDGRMPGSAAMLVRLDNGLELAVTVNKVGNVASYKLGTGEFS